MKALQNRLSGPALAAGLWMAVWAGTAARGAEVSGVWPLHLDTPDGQITVYQPMPESFKGDTLNARAALSYQEKGGTNLFFGAAWLDTKVTTDNERKTVTVTAVSAPRLKFSQGAELETQDFPAAIQEGLTKAHLSFSLPELQVRLQASEREQAAAGGLKTAPPRIYFSSTPAILVMLDGAPQLRTITNASAMRVVNTPYAMLFDPKAKQYWLKSADYWMTASDLNGAWEPVSQPPAEIRSAIPPEALTNGPALATPNGPAPRVIVASEPSELIVTEGEPTYTPVAGNDLLYVGNTESLLFLHIDTHEYYLPISGRWYHSASLNGPWNYVAADQLPAAFSRIPPGSTKSEALAFVAGTDQAKDAVLEARVPTVAAVKRDASVSVNYDGNPQFQQVENTPIQYATNTADAVFLVNGRYYCCRDAVWYEAGGATGPWVVATSVPSEIYSLPPSNPHYNVKYVYVYNSTPEVVYVGYEPAYAGCYVYGPTVVYGTGWWYHGYWGRHYACWSYPCSYGLGFSYYPYSGWSLGFGLGFNCVSVGFGWGWGGSYHCGWYGPYGACHPYYGHGYYHPFYAPYYAHSYGHPGYGRPGYGSPAYGHPGYGHPGYGRSTPYARAGYAAGRGYPAASPSLYARPNSSIQRSVVPQQRLAGTPAHASTWSTAPRTFSGPGAAPRGGPAGVSPGNNFATGRPGATGVTPSGNPGRGTGGAAATPMAPAGRSTPSTVAPKSASGFSPAGSAPRARPNAGASPSYSAPATAGSTPSYRPSSGSSPVYSAPASGSTPAGRSYAPSPSTPTYSAPVRPSQSYSAPTYSAPTRSAPTYSAPSYSAPTRSAPTYSPPSVSHSAPTSGGSASPRGSGGSSGGGFSTHR